MFPDMPWMLGSELADSVHDAARVAWPSDGPNRNRLFWPLASMPTFGRGAACPAGRQSTGCFRADRSFDSGCRTACAPELVWGTLHGGQPRALPAAAANIDCRIIDEFQVRAPRAVLFGARLRRRLRTQVLIGEHHALARLARIDAEHRCDRHADEMHDACEARAKFDPLVAETEILGRGQAQIEYDLAVFDERTRHHEPPGRSQSMMTFGVCWLSLTHSCIARSRVGFVWAERKSF